MPGTAAIRRGSRSPTRRTACGAIAPKFLHGRAAIEAFLTRKWAKELDYRLIKEVWTFGGNRIAVRFAYEWRDDSGNWFRRSLIGIHRSDQPALERAVMERLGMQRHPIDDFDHPSIQDGHPLNRMSSAD